MCGRYQLFVDEDALEIKKLIDEMNRREMESAFKPGMVRPTDPAPVLIRLGEKLAAKTMRWGFPKWDGGSVVINARSETAASKPMFSESLRRRRAVIPTMGFFEWRHEGKAKKEMYLFREHEKKMLYLAGFYQSFAMPDGGWEERFVILTTDANDAMTPFHDRMPVLLDADEREAWLADPSAAHDILHRIPPNLEADLCNKGARQAPEQMSLFSL